jgi:trans-aconitate 2-methyltransferase
MFDAMADAWNPEQYARFRDERAQPFFDLLALVEEAQKLRAVDLGCGPGELTRLLHDQLGCRETLGVDSSAAMLEKAAAFAGGGLHFEAGDIASFEPSEPFDLIFSNAAVQWVPEHPRVFERLLRALAPGGQLAVQMPANHDFPSHLVAAEVADREPFRSALGGYTRQSPVLSPDAYAELLHQLGFARQHVRLQVYGHLLGSSADVIEWVKGTLLTDYEKRLPPPLFAEFLQVYREALLPRLSARQPYFYPFKRLLLWARR